MVNFNLRDRYFFWVGNTLNPVYIGLPIAVLATFLTVQRLGYLRLSPEQCQLKKWSLPERVANFPQKSTPTQKNTPVLIQRLPISCCPDDSSCLDGGIYESEDGQIPEKKALVTSIERSLGYLQSEGAEAAYTNYPVAGVTRERVIKSLQRFRQLLLTSKSTKEFHASINREFVLYQSIGNNGNGRVLFTAYFEPIYTASRVKTNEFRYPIYRLPPDIESWQRPHPTRLELEGADGLQSDKGKLKGLEIFWFRDRLEPYMMQIQGSARLQLTDGSETTVGYAGNTAYNYRSIGKELIDDGKLPKQGTKMPEILSYFKKYPQELNVYIPRDKSFVFFREKHGKPAHGSVGVPLTQDRSIATDKALMPPGAIALIRSQFPFANSSGELHQRVVSRFVLDQDAGGAIKGPGRVDYFVGAGHIAGERAGVTVSNGHLYYLLLKSK